MRQPARAVVLGSAAGGGFPQWNCRCAVCALAWDADPRVSARTQSSIAATTDGENWIVFDASPDLGRQIAATPGLQPRRSLRHSPIRAVVLTSADVDHVAGLLTMRERHPFVLFALEPVHEALRASVIFDVLDRRLVERRIVLPGEPFEVAGLTIELFPVPGKAPLYREGPDPLIGVTGGETTGVLVKAGGPTLAYVPGCADPGSALIDKVADAAVLLFDGTLFTDDEMIVAGLGEKTGRRMGHVPISGPGGSLAALAELRARRKIFLHINNTNPILVEGSPERRLVERAGFEVAHDGLEIAL